MAAVKKEKRGKCLGRCDACSSHTTKLKQSIFFRYLWSDEIMMTTCHFIKLMAGSMTPSND
jgi:hypothetical protein